MGRLPAATQALFLLFTLRVDHLRIAQELVEEADDDRVGEAAVAVNERAIDGQDPQRARRRRDASVAERDAGPRYPWSASPDAVR
jgi:hypothetical protein